VKKKSVFIFWLILVSIFCTACKADSGSASAQAFSSQFDNQSLERPQILPRTGATLSGASLNLMLARTNEERAQGLMYYDSLEANAGMLFVYSSPRIMSFWMCNTKIPLDLIFFSEQLTVTEYIESMQPGYGQNPALLPRYVSQMPAQYALELNSGAIKQLGITVGDRLEIPLTLLYSE
jgi:uncharacterized membrane protein (UPF0127 family)